MAEAWDEFFITKINEGLAINADGLTPEEKDLLRVPAPELPKTAPFTPEEAQKLQSKCFGGLSQAYARDTTGRNRQAARRWRENYEALQESSKAVISTIVQSWYTSFERPREKRVIGCLPVVVGLGLFAIIIALSIAKLVF